MPKTPKIRLVSSKRQPGIVVIIIIITIIIIYYYYYFHHHHHYYLCLSKRYTETSTAIKFVLQRGQKQKNSKCLILNGNILPENMGMDMMILKV